MKVKSFVKRRLVLLTIALSVFATLNATHNRAGEITFVQKSALTYEITITTFTYTLSFADRPTLDVEWGDNTVSTAQRVQMVTLPNYYRKNVYIIDHTYPGPGVYRIVMQDPNRNLGVKNIPNSVNVVFSIETTLIVNPAMGKNSTPVLLNPPYDKAAYGHIFIHNPGAYDPDGDSLSYQLTVCTREDGKPIENYTLPPATHSIRVDSISGDLIWDTPADTGKFNVAMEIQEWRNGKKIGVVVRDMQIEVYNTNNKPPVNSGLKNYCVEAGKPVDFIFSATDPNQDGLVLHSTSGAFNISQCPATFTKLDSTKGFASARFRWVPCYQAVRNQPYDVIFKSEDNGDIPLADIDNIDIKVLGPAPNLKTAVPEGKSIRLTWDSYGTDFISGFSIYRREGGFNLVTDSCTSGLPASSGYIKVGYIAGSNTTSFIDSDNGNGLQYGREFSYRIVAVYPNGTESKASNEVRSNLISGLPVITKVSVSTTSPSNGAIHLAWLKPADSIPPPYKYRISRATGVSGNQYRILSVQTDTILADSLLDTQTTGYLYKIELLNSSDQDIGEPSYASSLYVTAHPGDKKVRFVLSRNVPWINAHYDFFRLNPVTSKWDSVGTTTQLTFMDPGLENGKEYCYYVRSVGDYPSAFLPKHLVNLSERVCVTPIDNEAPCIPALNVTSQCDSLYNILTWKLTDSLCINDVAGYRLYYKLTNEENLSLLTDIQNKNTFTYMHSPGEVISGCYAITTYDLNGNESLKSAMVCIDSCDFYEIPNVFTPNGDNINDRLVAKTSGLVESVNFKLYNRNGLLLFSTENPRIDWDGTYKGNIVSPGVYFYSCDVFERRISGIEQFHLSGFVHVITEKGSRLQPPVTK